MTLTCAQESIVAAELVLMELVNVMKATSTMKIFAWTFVKESIVESVETALVVTVLVKRVISRLKIFARKHVH